MGEHGGAEYADMFVGVTHHVPPYINQRAEADKTFSDITLTKQI